MESVGPFKILERLGSGALGELFRARDVQRSRTVALRIVSPGLLEDPAARDALVAAARAAAGFVHPHVAALLDVLEHEGKLLLVHELAQGKPLTSLLADGPLHPSQATRIAAQAAEAVAAAADRGLVHGALDPSNLLVSADNEVKVLDLGLAPWTTCGRNRRAAAAMLEGQAGGDDAAVALAAGYAAPEQVLGAAGDHRSDVFALGVILHRMLTGAMPFSAESSTGRELSPAGATLLKILHASPLPPSASNPDVPPALDAIVQRALAKSLDARYPSASAMAADLRALTLPPVAVAVKAEPVAQATTATAPGRGLGPRPAGPGRRGRRWLLPSIGAFVLLALAAAGAWLASRSLSLPWQAKEPPAPRPVVMVLPFTVVADTASSYYGAGFAEDLAARLSEIPGTTVVGRASIRALDAHAEWKTRARKLGAAMVVKGTLRPGQYALHADVQAVDAETGAVKWSQRFQREPRQVSGLEAEIAARLAQYLRLPTPTSNRWARASVRQIDPAAYDLYLQGREAADRRDRTKAIGLYDQALARDPRLVEARASLSQALYLEEYYAGANREPGSAGRALREAEAALAVDAELPAAHVAAALAAPTITMAASALARALAFDPSNGEAWHHAGDLVSELDPPRSVAFYRASLALEPTIDANWRDLASVQAAMGAQADAAQSVTKGEAERPDRPWWKQMRARLDIEQRNYDGVIGALLTDPAAESTPIVWLMGRVVPLSMAGRAVDARREANRLVERYPAFCEGRAVLAGVELDAGSHERGRELADAILSAARGADAEPAGLVCAALAAAATGDPAEAASWLSRVAGDERALRAWTRQAIFGIGLSYRQRWYPWTKVIGSQPMQVAGGQLEQSLARLREEVERRLPVPPGPVGAEKR